MWCHHIALFTCNDFGGGATVVITVVISCRLRWRRHAGSGPWSGSRPGWAREGPGVIGRNQVGGGAVVQQSVGRGGGAGRGGLWLPLLALRRLRGRVAWRLDQGVFAGVTSRGDGRVIRWAGCVGATGLGGEGAGLPGWGRGRFFGPFRRKRGHHNNVSDTWGDTAAVVLSPLRTMCGLAPLDPPWEWEVPTAWKAKPFLWEGGVDMSSRAGLWE